MLEQLFERESRTTRPALFFFVQVLQADRECAFLHVDAVADFGEVVRCSLVALLIAGIVEFHEDPFVFEVGLQHTGFRVCHAHRHVGVIKLEDRNVLELISFFLADVDLSAGELIDDLIASKQRHWIARSQIENRAAHRFLRSRCHAHIETAAKGGADRGKCRQRKADARDADAVGAQRDQFVVGG